jgi:hypothetical protein
MPPAEVGPIALVAVFIQFWSFLKRFSMNGCKQFDWGIALPSDLLSRYQFVRF